jgi:hypothetical protein
MDAVEFDRASQRRNPPPAPVRWRGNWLLHRGEDTGIIVLLKVHHSCERYSPASIRAHIKYVEPRVHAVLRSRSA